MVPVLIAANDDFCGLQSEITCDVSCWRYLYSHQWIQLSEGDYTLAVS